MTSPDVMAPAGEDQSIVDRVISSTLAESKDLLGNPDDIQHRPRNDKGQFTTIAGEVPGEAKGPGEWNQVPDATPEELAAIANGTAPPPPAAEATPEGEAPEPVIPDGFAKLPALAPEKVQGFKVMDADGNELEPPDLRVSVHFKNKQGEVVPETMDLPKLTQYARQGKYNHELHERVETTTRELTMWQQAAPKFEAAIKDRDARYERLLSDPQFLAAELTRYDTENTPEARQERERLKLEQDRQSFEFQRMTQQSEQYVDTKLAPALEKIAQQFPSVSPDELAAKLFLAAEPYRVNGVLHPNGFQHVAAYIVRELYPWAEMAHTDRSSTQTTPKAPVKVVPAPTPEKAQIRAAKEKRIGVAVMKPASGQPQGAPPNQKPPRTNRDMEEFVVGSALKATLNGS